MEIWEMIAVVAAGIGAGTINIVVGSGTLITFPVLLMLGVPPVVANVSNTVGLFPSSFVGAYGYRRELVGQGSRAITLGTASAVGALVGAILLLALPPQTFKAVVPVLISLALVLVIAGPWINRRLERSRNGRGGSADITVGLIVVIALTGVYGGYFGAAQGVLMLGFLGLFLAEPLQRQNALKNILVGIANTVASVVFIFTAEVNWLIVALIAAGSIVGGWLGARIGRSLSPLALRLTIVVVGSIALINLLR